MEPSILQDKIILIVDDYQVNTELLSLTVEDAGAISLTASNGLECLEIIKKQSVDLILMDRHMPVMDGIEATRAIRLLPQGKNIVIIGISGSDGEKESNDCLEAGMNLSVEKIALTEAKIIEIAGRFFNESSSVLQRHENSKSPAGLTAADEKNKPANQAIMDYEKALKEFENDTALLISLIVDFNKNIHSQYTVMKQALVKSDFECLRRESHGIKGGAANLCALPLAGAAKAIETACKNNAGDKIVSALLDNMACAIDSFENFVTSKTSH